MNNRWLPSAYLIAILFGAVIITVKLTFPGW